jgi:hypothetical protein
MAVCEYCSTRVLKDADAVKDLGKMSSVLEDYSPIQIGTAGVLGGRPFTVVGRIQLRYSAGMWNEWYLFFDDGKTSWLGDSSGMYTITAEYQGDAQLPSFEELRPGRTPTINGAPYTAAEIRIADCIGGQGELPFKVGDGYQAAVADFRAVRNSSRSIIPTRRGPWSTPASPSRWTACNASCCATTTPSSAPPDVIAASSMRSTALPAAARSNTCPA